MYNTYYLGKEGFVWFLGIVEDRKDPEELGRVRVRCFGYHTENKDLIPTDALPWAHIIQPANLPASYTCKEGEMVFGFFLDAYSAQQPVVIGVIPGKPKRGDSSKGFTDPTGKYPNRPGESTFSKLSRGGKYPKNYVHETESGHTFELDDNGSGRIKLSHNNGTYVEFDEKGNRISVVKKDNTVTISGDNTVSIGGDCTISVSGDCTFSVSGKFSVSASDISLSASGAIDMSAADINESASGSMNLSAVASLKAGATGVTSISGGTTTVSAATMLEFPAPLVGVQEGVPDAPSGGGAADAAAAAGEAGDGLEEVTVTAQKIEVPNENALVKGLNSVVKGVNGALEGISNGINNIVSTISKPLTELTSNIAKELEPLTTFLDKTEVLLGEVNQLAANLEVAIQPIETLVGKELFPRTEFYKLQDLQLDVKSYSTMITDLNDPLGKLNDKGVDLNQEIYWKVIGNDKVLDVLDDVQKVVELGQQVNEFNEKINELNKYYNLSAPKDKQMKDYSTRLKEVVPKNDKLGFDYEKIDAYDYFYKKGILV